MARPQRVFSTDGALLRAAGLAMFGDRWQSDLARGLGVSDRTVRRWLSDGDVPDGVWDEIEVAMIERQLHMGEIRSKLDILRKATKRSGYERR